MNRMLARVDVSVTRQRQLVADVSHDLQSPLATQRLSLELSFWSAGRGGCRGAALRGPRGRPRPWSGSSDELLVLAAADEGAPAVASHLDLDAVVLEEAARARSRSPGPDRHFAGSGPARCTPAPVSSAARCATSWTTPWRTPRPPSRSRVRVTDKGVVLDVVDDGPGVPPEERELVFDRFHRGDRARSSGTAGTGLGLAIARSLAERAGGSGSSWSTEPDRCRGVQAGPPGPVRRVVVSPAWPAGRGAPGPRRPGRGRRRGPS